MKREAFGIGIAGCCLMAMGEAGCFLDMDGLSPWSPSLAQAVGGGGAGQGGDSITTGSSGSGTTSSGQGGSGTTSSGQGGSGGMGGGAPCEENFTMPDGITGPELVFSKRGPTGSCYVWVRPPDGVTWDTAKASCEQNQMHLATITSIEERDFVDLLMEYEDKRTTWIGASRAGPIWILEYPFQKSSPWTWVVETEEWKIDTCPTTPNGCDPNPNYWKNGEPDEQAFDLTPDCVRIKDNNKPGEEGRFYGYPCNDPTDNEGGIFYLCEHQ